VSQFNPSTREHEESNGVIRNVNGVVSPVAKRIGKNISCVISEFDVPSNRRSRIGGIFVGVR
jgi:hypothetical protein